MCARILVTGGCGFIGTNLVRRLSAQGEAVRVLDDLSAGKAEDIVGCDVELVRGDIRDSAIVRSVIAGVNTVVHLAAQTGVVRSQQVPLLDFEVNARATLDLLVAARDAGAEKFVLASTGGAILGEKSPPVHEDMAPCPLSPYGASKLAAEAYCSAFHGSFALRTVALRFSNVYGPYSYHKGSVVAHFFKLIRQRKALTVYGDGTQTRDFVFVGDVVDAVLATVDNQVGGEVFHIASGIETSINQLIQTMREVVPGRPFTVHHAPARVGEVGRNVACIHKARRLLGYHPKMDLRRGLAATWAWFQGCRSAGEEGLEESEQ